MLCIELLVSHIFTRGFLLDISAILFLSVYRLLIYLSEALRRYVFDPVIKEIIAAIENMLEKTRDVRLRSPSQKIIFAGGLSQNPYVKACLLDHFKKEKFSEDNFEFLPTLDP